MARKSKNEALLIIHPLQKWLLIVDTVSEERAAVLADRTVNHSPQLLSFSLFALSF